MRKFLKKKKIVIGFGMVALLLAATIFYLSFFKKGFGPGSLTIDCAYFRKLSPFDNGTVYLFLKNEGKRPARITKIILDDIPLPDLTLSGLIDERDLSDSSLIPLLKIEEDDRVLWNYVYPNPIPPGKTAKVVVKCNFPPRKLLNIGVEDFRGNNYSYIVPPINNPIRFTYIGFNKEFNKVYLYLENLTKVPLKIDRIYLNAQDVTKDAFRPWENLSFGEKKCVEIKLKSPLTKGECLAAKIVTTDGLSTESLVRAFSFFPITTDSGNPAPDLNLDNENYLVSFSSNSYNKDISKNIIYGVLDCPTHAHGTWRNAGRKAIARTTACRDNDPYHLTYLGICKANQKRGSFAFAEISDTVKENPIESAVFKKNFTQHPIQIIAQSVKEASSPCPWFGIVQLTTDVRIEEFCYRTPTPEEAKLIAYYVLSRGAKGIFYRLPNREIHEALNEEVKKINGELQILKNLLPIAEPVPIAYSGHIKIEACTLQAGYEGIILFLINHDTKSMSGKGTKAFAYKPKGKFNVTVTIPEGMKIEEITEIPIRKTLLFKYHPKEREVTIPINGLDTTKLIFLRTIPDYEQNKSLSSVVSEKQPIAETGSRIQIKAMRGNPEEVYFEAKRLFDEADRLEWRHDNLKIYDQLIGLLEKVISSSKKEDLILRAQELKIQCYDRQAKYKKKHQALKLYAEIVSRGDEEKAAQIIGEEADKLAKDQEIIEAIMLYRFLIAHYQNTRQAPKAYFRMATLLKEAGDKDGALDKYIQIRHKYPESKEGKLIPFEIIKLGKDPRKYL